MDLASQNSNDTMPKTLFDLAAPRIAVDRDNASNPKRKIVTRQNTPHHPHVIAF
jgi:hypothetical protein